jgi:hypothetical protein
MKNNLLIILILALSVLFNFIPANAQNIPDFLVNEQVGINGSDQSIPTIEGDGNGNYVVTWQDRRNGSIYYDIYAQIYLNNDTILSSNFKVSNEQGNASQINPSVAVSSDMSFVIAWEDKRNGDWDIYAQRFANDGTAIGNNFRVNDDQYSEKQVQASVSIDSCGNFVIVWSDQRVGDNWDIYYQRYQSDGTALSNNVKINDDIGYNFQYWPTVSGDKNGNFIASWADGRNSNWRDIYAQRYSADGTALGVNFQVNTDTEGNNHLRADIAIDENGNFVISWEDNRNGYDDIFAQRYLSDGSTIGDNFKINDDTPNTSQSNASISMDLDGNFVVCWEDKRNDYDDIYARRFSNEGIPLSDDFKVNNDFTNKKQLNSDIKVDDNGNFIICWEDHRFGYFGEIYSQSYLNDGTPVDENLKVNDDLTSGNQEWPAIAKDTAGNFIIAWVDARSSGKAIYAQRYTTEGIPIGNNFIVTDDTIDNYTQKPSIAINLDGSFVITWGDFREAEIYNIYAQRFSNDATPLGDNFRVNFLSAALNYNPKVVCKQNGDFIICWGDCPEGGKDNPYSQSSQIDKVSGRNNNTEKLYGAPNIWAQQYLSDGTPLGENFKVNDDGGLTSQLRPDMSIDSFDNFVIAWEDERNDVCEIFLQRYLSDGTPVGSNFKVEDAILSDWQLNPSITSEASGNFTVTWRDYRNDKCDIFCRRFSNDGTPLGSSFQVNSNDEDITLYYPCISIGENGNFIISWTDSRNGTKDIFAQKYLSNGETFGENYRITNTSEMEQDASEIILAKNRVYCTWHDNKNENTGFDVWANVLDWGYAEQEISLHEGYQFVSTRINPPEPGMLEVLSEILNDSLAYVRNSMGQTLLKIGPNWVNGIGDWIVSEGYLIKMLASNSFSIDGTCIDPSTSIPVEQGFQFVSYFPENAMDALLAFATITNDNLDYIRNSQGQTLRKIGPIWVNGIGDCQSGEGYLVKMFANGEIIYPATEKSSGKTNTVPTHFKFEGGNAAEPVYTMYVKGLEIGDEVAAYDADIMVGALTITSENVFDNSLAIFSTLTNEKGYSAGNPIGLKVWDSKTGKITDVKYDIETIYESYVSDNYPFEDGKFSIVNITKGSLISDKKIIVYPNPATESITIVSPSEIKKVSIINCIGKVVYESIINDINTQINTSSFDPGIYFIRIRTTNGLETYKVAIK